MKVPQQCKGCGACCSLLTLKNIPITKISTGDRTLPIIELHYGKCQYLDVNNECTINDIKPKMCKDLLRGSIACLEFLKKYQ